MITKQSRKTARIKRHFRIRNQISGTPARPRLSVYRSNQHIYAQVIDDVAGKTLVAASTLEKDIAKSLKNTSNIEAAKAVGTAIAKKATAKNIESVVFDRGGYVYHGKVKALADSARESGLKF
ncbi:50S ribosomal protein L18 [Clostridia bacterium]|nr:50S ribosomal protein L18 [Clostridia bacterium]GHU74589.1 50S ribosomal protein L18 [Clostridia bacterium]